MRVDRIYIKMRNLSGGRLALHDNGFRGIRLNDKSRRSGRNRARPTHQPDRPLWR